MSSLVSDAPQTKSTASIEISIKGNWVKVPAIEVDGKTITITGKWLKIAAVHDEDWMEREIGDPQIFLKELKKQRSHGPRADIFTFTQMVPATAPKFKYQMELESIATAHIPTFKDWWERLPQESRKNVRRSQKRGVLVKVKSFDDELVKGIVEVNNDSPVRQGRSFTHYGKTFEQVKRDHSAFLDRSDFVCAYFGGEFIGFLKVVYRGEIASILQLLPKLTHSDKRPANAMLAKAIELCEAKGVLYLTYGMFNYGNKRNSAMREFKSRNGFEEMLIPRYYVPLTAWGQLCMKLKLHRGIFGILPGSLIGILTGVRARWYDIHYRRAGVAQ